MRRAALVAVSTAVLVLAALLPVRALAGCMGAASEFVTTCLQNPGSGADVCRASIPADILQRIRDGFSSWWDNVVDCTVVSPLRYAARAAGDFSLDMALALLEPEACILCALLGGVAHVVYTVGDASFRLLAVPLLVVMAAGLLLSKAISASKHFVAGERQPWRQHVTDAIWGIVAVMLLGGLSASGLSGAGDRAAALYGEMFDGVIGPLVNVSLDAGSLVMSAVAEETVVAERPSGAAVGTPDLFERFFERLDTDILPLQLDRVSVLLGGAAPAPGSPRYALTAGLLRLTLGVEHVAILGMARGITYVTNFTVLTEGKSIVALVSLVIGIILVVMFVRLFLVAGLRLLDPLLRLTMLLATLPILIACLPFPILRSATSLPAMRALGYCAVYLFVCGVVYALILALLLQSFVSITIPTLSLEQLYSHLSSFARSTAPGPGGQPFSVNAYVQTSSAGHSPALLQMLDFAEPIILLISLMFASALTSLIPQFAAAFSNYATSGAFSDEAERTVTTATQRVLAQAASIAWTATVAVATAAKFTATGGTSTAVDAARLGSKAIKRLRGG